MNATPRPGPRGLSPSHPLSNFYKRYFFALPERFHDPSSSLAFAAIVYLGVVEFHSHWLELHNAPARFRRITRVVIWCHAHPNSVRSSSLMVGAGSLLLFVYRLGVARRYDRLRCQQRDTVGGVTKP